MFSLGAMGVEEEQAQEWGERKEKEFLFGYAELGGQNVQQDMWG